MYETEEKHLQTLRSHYYVIDDFLPADMAEAMRQDIDAHFNKPATHKAETHQIWNYWYVGTLYNYLRTLPEKVISPDLVDRFMGMLRTWSAGMFGMKVPHHPHLSLYVDGCRQGLHNDAANGRFAFVYSLTRNERKTTGGDTLIMHEGDPFRSKLKTPTGGAGFYATVEPRFNRLVVFDARLPHAVVLVEGSMDPLEGRFVLHGHFEDGGPTLEGPLPAEAVAAAVNSAINGFAEAAGAAIRAYHGPIVFRFDVSSTGGIEDLHVLVDRVVSSSSEDSGWDALAADLAARLKAMKLPAQDAPTSVTQPVLIGGKLQAPDDRALFYEVVQEARALPARRLPSAS
jgi:Rps23 Pro-64 3,4-dihydroxylase Tpa1-like proline 4-hydroxylase